MARSENENTTASLSGKWRTGVQLGTTKVSFARHAKISEPISLRPWPSMIEKIVPSVERYGFVANPAGRSCMHVEIVGMAQSPVTGLVNFILCPWHSSGLEVWESRCRTSREMLYG